jgi:hypothetical protein
MKIHTHIIRLLLLSLAFQFSAPAQAQWLERTLQDFPYTRITHAIAADDGYVFTISHSDFNAHNPFLYRVNGLGQVVWVQPVPVEGDMLLDGAVARDLVSLDDGTFLLALDLWYWDAPAGCAVIHYDAEGEEMNRWESPNPWDRVLAVLPVQAHSPWPMLLIMEGQELWRVDHPSALPVILDKVSPTWPPVLGRDTLGRILVSVQGGIAEVNPTDGGVSAPVLLTFQPPRDMHTGSDGTLTVLWQDRVQIFDLMGMMLWQHVVTDAAFTRMDRIDDRLYVFGKMNGSSDALLLLDMASQSALAFLPPLTSIVHLQGALPGASQDLLWGRERHNAFIKSIGPDGHIQPLVSDARVSDFQHGDAVLTTSYGPGQQPITYNVLVKDPLIEVTNDGPDSLHSVIVNYAVDVADFGFPAGMDGFPRRMLRLDSLDLAPGESSFFELPHLLFRVDAFLSGPLVKGSFCVELSCPNDRIDAYPANNRFCVTVADFTSTTVLPDGDQGLRVFPNPFSQRLEVEGIPAGARWGRLTDPTGRELAKWDVHAQSHGLWSVPAGPAGVYVVRWEDAVGRLLGIRTLIRHP